MNLCIPANLRIFCHENGRWQYVKGESFYNPTGEPPDLEFAVRKYEISREKMVIELFRAGEGKPGYYIGDLQQKHFYYCGIDSNSVQDKLRSLGIGRDDPMESP